MLNVWIGNLGKYNEGELVGEWLELPVSKKELDTFLREKVGLQLTQDEVEKALAENGVCYEEYMINDYETDLPIKVSEYTNLTMLNLLALASERVNNMEAVEAYIDSQGTDDIEEIINIMLQEDDIPFYSYEEDSEYLSNEEKYGMSKANWSGLQDVLDQHNVSDYFDYERYGADDDVILYDTGYLDSIESGNIDLHYYSLEEIKKDHGKIDGLLHAIAHANTEDLRNDFILTSRDGYAHAQDVSSYSLIAIVRMAREKEMLNEGASIVAYTYYGSEKAIEGYNVMGVAKAALEASIRYLARDLGKDGYRINAISAGPIKTLSAKGIKDFNSILDVVEERAPLHRNVTIKEVGDSTAFLFSNLSSAITGEVIHVDSGFSTVGV